MVTDRNPLVVGQQRIVRAEELADIHSVVHTGVEVSEVADGGGQLHRYIADGEQHAGDRVHVPRSIGQQAGYLQA